MSPEFVQVKVVYSSVREIGKCGMSEAETWGIKKKALWLRQSVVLDELCSVCAQSWYFYKRHSSDCS